MTVGVREDLISYRGNSIRVCGYSYIGRKVVFVFINKQSMALTKDRKKEMIKELEGVVTDAGSVVFVHTKGLPVNETNDMRSALSENGAGYKVVKKTLLNLVLDNAKLEGEKPTLDGEIAIAYGEDLTAPAREVYAFQKKYKEGVSIVGGIFDHVFKTQDEMVEIAQIPGIRELRGMFVNVINSPIQGFASVLHQIAEAKSN